VSIRRSLSILGAAILFLCAVPIGGAIYARHQARTVIEKIRNVDTAADPTAASRSLMRLYSDRLVSQNCEREFCQYQFLFTNGVISKLRIAPRAEIRMYVSIYAGNLSDINVQYTSAVFKADSPIVSVQEDFCGNRRDISCEHFAINPHGRDVGQTWNGDVEFGQKATREQKRAAWALNLHCVAALRGCKDISQLLPTVWKLTGPGTVSSRMRSTADSIAEALEPLPE
jgi:hypothetical protein